MRRVVYARAALPSRAAYARSALLAGGAVRRPGASAGAHRSPAEAARARGSLGRQPYAYLVESIRRFPAQAALADLMRQAGTPRVP